MHYLYIYDDGTILVGNKPTMDDIDSADEGLLRIINTRSNKEYVAGQWDALDIVEDDYEEEDVSENEEESD